MMKLIRSAQRRVLCHAAGCVLLFSLPVQAEEEVFQVSAEPVREIRVASRIEALGTLYANETAVLAANLTETISEINFSDGQRVKAGDILVALTNREQLAQLDEARTGVADAEQQLERARQLIASKYVSRQELDDRTREFNIAKARLRAVEARLADRLIRAPFDSVVGLRQVSVGTLLTPGMAVTTLHDDSVMKLDFTVPELRLADIQPGQRIIASSRAFAEEQFEGEVAVLDNEVDLVTRSIRVRALIPNPAGLLRPGMLMKVLVEGEPRQALVIPEGALLPLGKQQFVMVVTERDGETVAGRLEVKIGERSAGMVEVVEGLSKDQQVITHGNFRVSPGQQIEVKVPEEVLP
ncbi:efflux RND transporter periplasmic adaptor subunit [Pseudomonas sp. MYb185]|uniref:efflux RND transporter periplasmic adaptor subunit n=1 Tax=Pseudomonas sp. MYb185 TaxID=1848729 RepID=UPI000CFC76A1|nr:efflux RND transporter periplasmic adaptor subunit [Pseudomonas sp. MYb185]PRB82052.1 efflux transporter periplasmic adaptor subunit [Pseudomonas sp. MYb185]